MNMIFFGAALLLILSGHLMRCSRWKNMLSAYEEVPSSKLLSSMGLGYFIDLLIPFHAGDIVRAAVCGKKLKNKTSFALATIIIDRLLDVHIVTLIYLLFFISGGKFLMHSVISYVLLTCVLTLLIFWSGTFSKPLKKMVLAVSSVFNKDIQLWIMSFFWAFRCTVKGIINKNNKLKLFFKTLAMWICYLAAYHFLAKVLSDDNLAHSFDRFFSLTKGSSLISMIPDAGFMNKTALVYIVFNFLTAVLLMILSFIAGKLQKNDSGETKAELIMPYSSENNRLDFLTIYFSDIKERENIRLFLDLNKGVNIIRNFSAGSNATTLLCIKDGKMMFRKYTLGKDSDKLNEQITWLKNNSKRLSVTDILDMEYDGKICRYDMPYLTESVSFFDYIHSSSADSSWKILKSVLEDLESMYSSESGKKADKETIKKYISSKVFGNLQKINEAGKLKSILAYDEIVINGTKFKNLGCFTDKLMSEEFWTEAFGNDDYCTIHGDLTIENIICNRNYPKGYYLIDPNGGNIHNSPNLDYAKLLQSLHGGYEFLMKTHKINVSGNEISFNMIRSASYDSLYNSMREYMLSNFSPERVRSIYLHEMIHWFRLMPYKINNDTERAPLFYAGMIMVMNDIFKENI